MWSGGDAAEMPPGYARRLRSVLFRSRVAQKRPPFTYDNLGTIHGLAQWKDASQVVRMCAMKLVSAGLYSPIYVKSATSEAWTIAGGVNHSTGLGIRDYVNYRGVLYYIGTDNMLRSYNGTTDDAVRLGGGNLTTAIKPHSLAIFKDRLFIGGATYTIRNLLFIGATDYTYVASNWTLNNVTASAVSSSGTTTYRITPTDTADASLTAAEDILFQGDNQGVSTVRWRAELRSAQADADMPFTLILRYSSIWLTGESYGIGRIVVPTTLNGFRYRCVSNGTSHATTEPVWPTTVGDTIVDNTVTWLCEDTDIAASAEYTLPRASSTSTFSAFSCVANAGIGTLATVRATFKFGNTARPTYTLGTVDFAYKDGRPDGDPLKGNHGHQITYGSFAFPFHNVDVSNNDPTYEDASALLYSEVGAPTVFSASARYPTAGDDIVALVTGVGGVLLVFTRNSITPFAAVEDERIVVLPEGEAIIGFGTRNPKSVDVRVGMAYFADDNDVYRWKPGMPEPVPLCGDAMRDEITDKSAATWVESQAAPSNRVLLAIDQSNGEMWVYAQKGKPYCYRIATNTWTGPHDVGGGDTVNPTGHEFCDMAYNETTRKMYFAFTSAPAGTPGVARLDPTVTPAQDSISTSGTIPVIAEIWPRPIEASTPSTDVRVDTIRFYHKVTENQGGQTMRGDISFDQGVSFTKSLPFDLAPLSTGGFVPLEFPTFQEWNTIQTRLVHIGEGGAGNFAVSRIEADIQVTRGYYPKNTLTSGSSTL